MLHKLIATIILDFGRQFFSYPSPILQTSKIDREAYFKELESKLLILSEDFLTNMLAINNTLLDNSEQINGLKIEGENKLSTLKRENHALKVETSALEERISNLSFILADLRGKVKQLKRKKQA